ncbi:MAG TPA: sigma-54-dependent Fis family transcriptional regulator [Pirellulaceae bacterium]|nr:sigma-54-dependent Fis family transcriptional regulator [Pirellulaceae bacterium]
MNHDRILSSFDFPPQLAGLAATLLEIATHAETAAVALQQALPALRTATQTDFVAVVRGEKGRWRTLGIAGNERALPTELLAESLDQMQTVSRVPWHVAPLDSQASSGELLAIYRSGGASGSLAMIELAELLRVMLLDVRARQRRDRRIERLEAILTIAAQWRQTLDMDQLLIQMAEASTKLLGAERASIFLWDKAHRQLVGRPALGVPNGELRIGDDVGIVGQVVQSGEPRRVDADLGQEEIDRSVDKQLKFQTKTLLCVPLRGQDGELFGAFEMINKRGGNFSDDDEAALIELASHAALALEQTQQYAQLLKSRNQLADQAAEGVSLVGECAPVAALRSTIRRIAPTNLAVLILGENGTGKEVVSRMIHVLSDRKREPLVAVNCAALTETLLESELFGHEKGAFTDARETRQGKFELASGGTLFLDEIGDMSLGGQAKLLRVLEEKTVVRVGGSTPIRTDARVIAATNQKLAELVRQRKFREDLYFRLNVVTLDMPPLRERGDDILILAEHFLGGFAMQARRKAPKFTAAAKKRLLAHAWPGNVRELRNLMERLAYLTPDDKVDADELSFILSPGIDASAAIADNLPLTDATQKFQTQYIERQIQSARGNMTDAAERLGLHRSNLYRKMRQLGMETSEE